MNHPRRASELWSSISSLDIEKSIVSYQIEKDSNVEDAVFGCEMFETRYQTKITKRIIRIVDALPVSFDKLI